MHAQLDPLQVLGAGGVSLKPQASVEWHGVELSHELLLLPRLREVDLHRCVHLCRCARARGVTPRHVM